MVEGGNCEWMDSRFSVYRTPVILHGCWQAPRLCLLMTPGLAFFYGGMVRAKGVLNMLMMSISAMGVVTVLWLLYGYSHVLRQRRRQPVRQPDAVLGPEGPDRRQRDAAAADPSRDRRRRCDIRWPAPSRRRVFVACSS